MTIGIAAYGENAGRAVLAALAAAESVGTGAIGGFVSAVAISGRDVLRGETQTGGGAGVVFSCSRATFETAGMAALISSGPDRPEPLSAFTVAAPDAGVVTGHRLPNVIGQDGVPMNQKVLDLMGGGTSAHAAVEAVILATPGADCGLAAIDSSGSGHVRQTPAASRPDSHLLCQSQGRATVCIVHNAIQPHRSLAALTAEIALQTMQPDLRALAKVTLSRGCPVRDGALPVLMIDTDRHVREIRVPEPSQRGVHVLNLGYRPKVIGGAGRGEVLAYEPFVVVRDGVVVSVDGTESMHLETGAPA